MEETELEKKQSEVRKLGTIRLQGKDYLQVAHRVLLFRLEHPNDAILTEFTTVAETVLCTCRIARDGNIVSTAHKSVQPGGEGPAGKYPMEMAETGAIGRALNLCGYGTLSGDLDEGDQIADAPQKSRW